MAYIKSNQKMRVEKTKQPQIEAAF